MTDSTDSTSPFVKVIDGCPAPFLTEADYPPSGGYIPGRLCGPSLLNSSIECCLPCPVQHWVYSDDFLFKKLPMANWIHVVGFALCSFLLISFTLLPPEKSHRHYLSIGLIIVTMMIQLSFIIPLGSPPNLCYNDITPSDMRTELQCAWTGALVQAGGMGTTLWIFLRVLWMHLRVCWDIVPGQAFFWFSQVFGWGTNAILLIAGLAATGVSNRIGSTCLPNHPHTVADFWAWLIVFSGLAVAIQLATSGYYIWIYVRNLLVDHRSPAGKDHSFVGNILASSSFQTIHAKSTWLKVRGLLFSQWRSLLISVMVIVEAGYFTGVFLKEDVLSSSPITASKIVNLDMWAVCLIESGGDKNACLGQGETLTLRPSTVLSSVVLVSLIGVEIFILLARPSLVSGWFDLMRCGHHQRQSKKDEQDVDVVDRGRPSCVIAKSGSSIPAPISDLEKGLHGWTHASQPPTQDTAAPLLTTLGTGDMDPLQVSMPPTPLPKDTPRSETFPFASHSKTIEGGSHNASESPKESAQQLRSHDGLDRPTSNRRSRFLEARFSREEPAPLDFGLQTFGNQAQIQTHSLPPEEEHVVSSSSRPLSSPNPVLPRVMVRSPSGSRRSRPLSGLWRSLSKGRRETAIDLKAGRGGLALHPIQKNNDRLKRGGGFSEL